MFSMSDGRPAPANPDSIVQGETYRFTVLTSRLIRMEYSPTGRFVDQRTQLVTSRDFPAPDFTTRTLADGTLEITTHHLRLRYSPGAPFTPGNLSVAMLRGATDNHYSTWRFATDIPQHLPWHGNFGGTARTLDDVDGTAPLGPGLFATYGFSVLDDSTSPLLSDDGWVTPRPGVTYRPTSAADATNIHEPPALDHESHDLYLFGYGQDFRAGLTDYHRLTGPSPLLPRYALGNWWSRYWPYSEESYLELLDRFEADGLPFSVAVLDMDWHIVDVEPEIGTGWTGYTWNPDLFPNPRRFLTELHKRGLAVTLNVHPADGVRRHEEYYPQMARALGRDPEEGHPIEFDVTDREFVDAYLTYLHHPREEEGTDFWWVDWQSGATSALPGVDPLWMLNHIHFTDSARPRPATPTSPNPAPATTSEPTASEPTTPSRPLTFSRYAGPGSHRYPVGFSGDTVISWASLHFQPEFTATAANIGYPWWSHDIGGHMFGHRSDELATRWLQLGTFSPINRLHTTAGPLATKEPWTYGPEAERIMGAFLRLRHRLLPYLYTANWATHAEHIALVRPMYQDFPAERPAYAVPNQSMFGEHLIVAPITSPSEDGTRLATTTAWLPSGRWTDIFTGRTYLSDGAARLSLHRPLAHYPVLARAGAVIPLASNPLAGTGGNPRALTLLTVPGTATSHLCEDDLPGAVPSPEDRRTWVIAQRLEFPDDGAPTLVLTLAPPSGPPSPTPREVTVDVVGLASVGAAELRVGDEWRAAPSGTLHRDELLAPALRFELGVLDLNAGFELRLEGLRAPETDRLDEQLALIQLGETAYGMKNAAWAAVQSAEGVRLAQALEAADVPAALRGALLEVEAAAQPW